ncbi:MAG: efflux RND transporter periplasmic adaptor subunit [Patescibacteria group bacterium]
MKKLLVGGVIVVFLAALAFSRNAKSSSGKEPEVATALRGTVTQEVSARGTVAPVEDVELSFDSSGRVGAVFVDVGDRVKKYQLLATLQSGELSGELAQARATVSSEQARLKEYEASIAVEEAKLLELRRGTREEDMRVKEAEYAETKQKLKNDYADVSVTLDAAFLHADDALRKKTDALFFSDEENPILSFVTRNSASKSILESERWRLGDVLTQWGNAIKPLSADDPEGVLEAALTEGRENLVQFRNFLNVAMDAVSDAVDTSSAATYKADITTARVNLNAALSDVNAVMQAIASQKNALDKISRELERMRAGTREEIITAQEAALSRAQSARDAQEAQIAYARGRVTSVEAQLAKKSIRAPFAGTVTERMIDPGETAAGGKIVLSLVSSAGYAMESFIPEVDIGKVRPGALATVSFDAYRDSTALSGAVSHIDPAETMREGVATYNVTFAFDNIDPRVKPGMTGDIQIIGERRENVLFIPERALLRTENGYEVRVREDDGTLRVSPVTIGLRGSDGAVEITEGIEENETVVVSPVP